VREGGGGGTYQNGEVPEYSSPLWEKIDD